MAKETKFESMRKDLFERLAKSRFRSKFRLGLKEQKYLANKGDALVLEHARDFLTERLAPAKPQNDGSQTPMRGHPVFIAQHATGLCCRKCLRKWHGIGAGKEVPPNVVAKLVDVIGEWLARQPRVAADDVGEVKKEKPKPNDGQMSFF